MQLSLTPQNITVGLIKKNFQFTSCYLKKITSFNKDYQPGWTLVGGGVEKAENMCRLEKDQIPKNVDFFQNKASVFDPDQNSVELDNGKKVYFKFYHSISFQRNFLV